MMKPEYKLPLTVISGVIMPVGFFWYGWAAQAKIHWIMPFVGTAVLGYGNAIVYVRRAFFFALLSAEKDRIDRTACYSFWTV